MARMPKSKSLRARIRRSVERLPSPRDEHALTLLRSARGLMKGTPATGVQQQPAVEKKQRTVEQAAIERPVRTVPKLDPVGPKLDPIGTDPAEQAAVRAGWQLVGAYERLSTAAARKVFEPDLQAWFAYARENIPELEPWGGPGGMAHSETDTAKLRFRRTMDFVRPGERVFDVGFGRGHLAGMLMKERKLAGYHGVDIVDWHVKAFHEMVAANGLEDAEIGLTIGDLYDLTREQVEDTGANLVICCEVLEHVPDAELGLRKLADALPEGADLLFSVPLYGRLEPVWGHVSVFDTSRLKAMLDGAGLIAHHVEPVGNIWAFVVASRSPQASQRVLEASGRPDTNVSRPLSRRRDFIDLPAGDFSAKGCELVPADDHAVTCVIASGGSPATVSFPVRDGVEAARLKITFDDFEQVQQVHVRATQSRKAKPRGEWIWTPKPGQVPGGTTKRLGLRPGESTPSFRTGPCGDLTKADRMQVEFTVPAGAAAKFTLWAAYLPAE